MNIQDWFPLGLTGLISFQSKGPSSIFSSITIQKHQFFSAQPSLWTHCHIHIAYWKNHSFHYTVEAVARDMLQSRGDLMNLGTKRKGPIWISFTFHIWLVTMSCWLLTELSPCCLSLTCNRLNVVSPWYSCIEILNPSVMELGDGAFWYWALLA